MLFHQLLQKFLQNHILPLMGGCLSHSPPQFIPGSRLLFFSWIYVTDQHEFNIEASTNKLHDQKGRHIPWVGAKVSAEACFCDSSWRLRQDRWYWRPKWITVSCEEAGTDFPHAGHGSELSMTRALGWLSSFKFKQCRWYCCPALKFTINAWNGSCSPVLAENKRKFL